MVEKIAYPAAVDTCSGDKQNYSVSVLSFLHLSLKRSHMKTEGQAPSGQAANTGDKEWAGRSIIATERSPLRISTFCMVLGVTEPG